MRSHNKALAINSVTSAIQQVVIFVCGLILPRLLLSAFGSEGTGLVSSISQFLGFIYILEGGLGGVIRAAYYKHLVDHDKKGINGVYKASDIFFKKIGIVFIPYSIVLAAIYPIVAKTTYDYWFIFLLTIVLSFSSLAQYFFGASGQLLIYSDQRSYYLNVLQIGTVIANTILSAVLIKLGASLLVVKLASALTYVVRPFLISRYVSRHYHIRKHVIPDHNAISQRWSGLGQFAAFFIHQNTDVAVITLFLSVKSVAIYAIHSMVVKNLSNFLTGILGNTEVTFGHVLARKNSKEFIKEFKAIDIVTKSLSTVIYITCAVLICQFVMIYTHGIKDANYYQPAFALIFTAAEWIYCMGLNYNNVIMASGHIKQTTKYFWIEAIINIVFSIIFVKLWGIAGVVLGTGIAMLYKFIFNIVYVNKRIIKISLKYTIKSTISNLLSAIICIVLFWTLFYYRVHDLTEFFIYAVLIFLIVCIINLICNLALLPYETISISHSLIRKFKAKKSVLKL